MKTIPSSTDLAFRLACRWHDGQLRKGDGLPYIIHPVSVALMLAEHGFSEDTIAAGFCHDLLEDTACAPEEIARECGEKVLEIVKAVTNEDTEEWERKKTDYIARVRSGPAEAKAVCVADKICNLRSLIEAYGEQGPAVWKKFTRGQDKKLWFERNLLEMLKETWDHPILAEYERLIEMMAELERD